MLRHLPDKYHAAVRRHLHVASEMTSYEEAKEALQKLAKYLQEANPPAAARLKEGLGDTLTLHKLAAPTHLRKTLCSTNLIES